MFKRAKFGKVSTSVSAYTIYMCCHDLSWCIPFSFSFLAFQTNCPPNRFEFSQSSNVFSRPVPAIFSVMKTSSNRWLFLFSLPVIKIIEYGEGHLHPARAILDTHATLELKPKRHESVLARVHKNKSMQRLISSLWGPGTAKFQVT